MKRELGQVFTTSPIVQKMLALKQNNGRILEPSCGDGAFSKHLDNCVAIELDASVAPEGALVMDFFDWGWNELGLYDSVIGNPPYLCYKEIPEDTKDALGGLTSMFDKRSNLYLFFIYKSALHLVDGGELIFIVPREFRNSTSARKLNEWLYENGSFTHWEELGDEKVFKGATPNTVIFRWQKDLMERTMPDGRIFSCVNGQLLFKKPSDKPLLRLGDLFDVKVGAVSGADYIFEHPSKGNVEFVCSSTFKDGDARKMLHAGYAQAQDDLLWIEKYLIANKHLLLERKIKKFDESNWWEWGRWVDPQLGKPRIYVNCKTRNSKPFFTHSCEYWDGSILALFPKQEMDLQEAVQMFNDVDWDGAGFKVGGRLCFGQKSLENAMIEFNLKGKE